ncbi:hypothetical protein QQ045_003980 [Rhodiola kirilowii]
MNMFKELGLVEGIRICKNAHVISRLMYAEDCMLFVKAKVDSLRRRKEILEIYEVVSYQRVNFTNSEGVCSSNVVDDFKKAVEEELQIRITESHSSYLGQPIFFNNKVELFRTI